MKIGDIVLIPFPFSELNEIKVRPAVVLAETADKYKDLIIAAISSSIPEQLTSNEFVVVPSTNNKLRSVSVVKVDRLMTIKENKIIAELGSLEFAYLNQLRQIFKSLVD